MPRNVKIKDLDKLAAHLAALRKAGKKIVLSHGVFDLLHVGHIRHFETARAMGDVLAVTITPDKYVNKGPHRPAFSQDLRAEVIASLAMVDYVAVNRWPSSVETIGLLHPDIYVKGSDYKDPDQDITGGIARETEAVRAVGGEVRFTDEITFSSSGLLNAYLSPFSEEVDRYLSEFRKQYSEEEVLHWLDNIAKIKPLVVGEAIIDEYQFGDVIGKSTKDPVLAVLEQSAEAYAGGTLAIANHLAGLCNEVGLVIQLGELERREDWIRSSLRPNVRPVILTKSGSPTVRKRRVIDRYSGSKLLEIYAMNDQITHGNDARELNTALAQALPRHDLTVVADYGHGMLIPEAIALLCDSAPFLAINVQSNAGNRGFNPISKYRRADYVCVANHEVDMEMRQRYGDLEARVMAFTSRVACPLFTITMGKSGTLHYSANDGFVRAPALASRVLDRVGAGDAVLAVTALLAKAGAPWDILAFIGNVAGAHMVAELGNRVPLERVALSKHITSLLK